MKVIKHISVLILLLSGCFSLLSQDLHPILDRFSAFNADGIVQIECVISSGSTCNGIDVLRSTDGERYEIIGNISGVCGSSSHPVTYNFQDSTPVINAPNYYKLALGGFGFTEIITITIRDIEQGKLRIAPNPSSGITQIYFENPRNYVYSLSIVNLLGESIFQMDSRGDVFEIDVSELNPGYYFTQVSSPEINDSKQGALVVGP